MTTVALAAVGYLVLLVILWAPLRAAAKSEETR